MMAGEPLTDAQLAEIRNRVENQVATQVEAEYLLAEVDRVRDERDAYAANYGHVRDQMNALRAELAEARMKAAAEIHEEGHRLMAHDSKATLHQLLSFIERKYGKDLLATYWSE